MDAGAISSTSRTASVLCVTKSQTVPWGSQSPTLSALPTEVIDCMIVLVKKIAEEESRNIQIHRFECLKQASYYIMQNHNVRRLERQEDFYTIQHDDGPILNSLQALGAVSKRFHALCRPWLWKTIILPSPLPVPIDTWTEGILPRHGSLVRSVWLNLSKCCLLSPHHLAVQTLWDNTIPCFAYDGNESDLDNVTPLIANIGPIGLIQILTQCPNLHLLSLGLPDTAENMSSWEEVQALENLLVPLFRNLKSLRHLTLVQTSVHCERIACQILGQLPMLNTFQFIGEMDRSGTLPGFVMKASEPAGFTSLAQSLSQLRRLRVLDLGSMTFLDSQWSLHNAPDQLTHLSFDVSHGLGWRDAHRFIQRSASTLTSLTIFLHHPISKFNHDDEDDDSDSDEEDDDDEDDGDKPKHIYQHHKENEGVIFETQGDRLRPHFDLPELAHLALLSFTDDGLLSGFRKCKNLHLIKYHICSPTELRKATHELEFGTWPQLNQLEVGELEGQGIFARFDAKRLKAGKETFHALCVRRGINLTLQSG